MIKFGDFINQEDNKAIVLPSNLAQTLEQLTDLDILKVLNNCVIMLLPDRPLSFTFSAM